MGFRHALSKVAAIVIVVAIAAAGAIGALVSLGLKTSPTTTGVTTSTTSATTTSSLALKIVDSDTAKSVNTTTRVAIGRTQSFLSSDAEVYSWLNFTNVPSPTHNVTWVWLTPQRTIYWKANLTTPDPLLSPPPSKIWKDYQVWDPISIKGHQASSLIGSWEIDVYVDGQKALVQTFTIGNS